MAQPFPPGVVASAWQRSRGQCECSRDGHSHHAGRTRCPYLLRESARGDRESESGWEAHHRVSTGPPTLLNCQILCCQCHKETGSFGG